MTLNTQCGTMNDIIRGGYDQAVFLLHSSLDTFTIRECVRAVAMRINLQYTRFRL